MIDDNMDIKGFQKNSTEVPSYNMLIPFMVKIPTKLKIGSTIHINGCMTSTNNGRFIVNLQAGSSTDPRSDTALHLSVRPNEHTIVRNIYTKQWDFEERSGYCPVSLGQKYHLSITIGPIAFRIFVNRQHYCDFKYRIPFNIVSFISIEGETTIKYVKLDEIDLTPFLLANKTDSIEKFPALNPPVPFISKLSNRLKVGNNIQIIGFMTRGNNGRFAVNLQCGSSTNPRDDIALHLSVRPNERTIVRNTYRGKWEAEERSTSCPISCDQTFHLTIAIKENCFAIYVNKKHYCDFKFRFPFDKISFINVEGDTKLGYIDIVGYTAKEKKIIANTAALNLTKEPLSTGIGKLSINEPVKFFANFPYPLHAESKIRIAGTYNEKDKFTGCLLSNPGKNLNSDTELILIVRPKEFTVIRIVHPDGSNSEESRGSWTISSGQKYTILIHVKRNNFLIYINDELCCNLSFRLPFFTASHLCIKGETTLDFVEVNDIKLISGELTCEKNAPPESKETKFLKCLSNPLQIGDEIHINGSVNPGGDGRFFVNLLSSNTEVTALHLGIYPGNTIVRSIHNQDGWNCDEFNDDGCPISVGEDYDILIKMNYDRFEIFLNGDRYCDYSYRFPLETVAYVNIEGQTSLKFARLRPVIDLLK